MIRQIVFCFVFLLGTRSTFAQQSAGSDDAMRQLREEIARLATALDSTRTELQQCRDEIHELRNELQGVKSPAGAAGAETNADLAHSLADLREDEQMLDTRVGQLYQTKVESGSKYRVRLSGLLLFNTYANHGATDNTESPNLALPLADGQSNANIGGTFRQSIFTLQTFGPELAGAKTSGELQFDFYGGFTKTLDGYTMGIARLRTANIEFDWAKWSLRFTQDKPFIAPLTPTTIAAVGTPEFAYSGNLWTWTPQIIGERTWALKKDAKAHLQFGVLDPFDGEYPVTSFNRQPEAGELSRTPGLAARQSWDFGLWGNTATVGAGGYYARQNYDYGRVVDAWAATLDWNVPLGKLFALSGELHRGRALGGMWGGIGTSVVYTGPTDDSSVVGVNTVGGWSQLKLVPATKWEFNAAFGEESPFAHDLRMNGQSNYYPVLRNWTTMVNVIEHARSNLLFSLEYRHLNSVLFSGDVHTADQLNLGVGVAF